MTTPNPKVPRFLEDADMSDPKQHCAWAISQWPKIEKMMEMPTPAPMIPYLSEFLVALGFRFDPDKAVLFKVPDPETGRGKFVDREEYEQLKAEGGGSVVEAAATREAMELLTRINPALAKEIASMSPEDKAARLAEFEESAGHSMNILKEMKKQMGG